MRSRVLALVLLFLWYQAPEALALLGQPFPVWAGVMLLFLPVAWLAGRALLGYRPGLAAYALEWRPGALRVLLLLLGASVLLRGLTLWVGASLGVLTLAPLPQPPTASALALGVLGALLTTVFPSVAEDILTRGFWYRAWPVAGRGAAFVAFSAGVFVLNHIYRLGLGPREWLMLACAGLAFAAATVRTGSLWGAVGLHWGWNLASNLFDLVLDVQVLRPPARTLLSAGTGLALLALVLLLPARVLRTQAVTPSP
ncbi:CPBP family intramembrane metalloprotease [Aggregicoccus sp. 17bor-14]|uniref:CPBP family intramembrane glutamic endopeptidase n=1 Tax=Myxococcaceae TaxID=31 RepID=UPI00129C95F2|nr:MULTISPECIES: CPBP family intramembrane glutamic endopeptidase [Myxococcaceae]MBF5041624.1 CPBP family intramembrane metalloprotease [Simulacricoccus sp. 17bor-14]MRI87409.1 CPBP family intramembrane metalloprotease [Aggregicoccus sp. 17bor-14]